MTGLTYSETQALFASPLFSGLIAIQASVLMLKARGMIFNRHPW